MNNTDLSIILVNYNSSSFIINCINSFIETIKCSYEIIIVNNNSDESEKNKILKKIPQVQWHEMNYNAGFSRANNFGIQKAQGKYILLLNPDTLIVDGAIDTCLTYYQTQKANNIGVLGCKLLHADLTLQFSFFKTTSISKLLTENSLYLKFNKNSKEKYTRKLIKQHSKIFNPNWLCGAFFLFEKELNFQFDTDFFMYAEDLVFCEKISKHYKIVYYPNASIIHLGGSGTNASLVRQGQIIISNWLSLIKIYNKLYFIFYIMLLIINYSIDDLFYYKHYFFKKLHFNDKKAYIYRRFMRQLICKYFITLLFSYKKKSNSCVDFLKYNNKI